MPGAGWDCHVHVFDGQARVAPGHYQPVHRPLADIEALAQHAGFGHLVLVQPSVYGTDNTVLLDALRSSCGRHRGVVVLEPSVQDTAFEDMHALGVRGIRFNLVSPVGPAGKGGTEDIARSFRLLAPRLRALGWHVQWYAHLEDLPFIAGLHRSEVAFGVPAVLDHLAGLHACISANHPARQALSELAALGAWVKLSGWYRLQATAPYEALDKNIQKVAGLFEGRMVWGSDWPHTSFAPAAMPAYAEVLEPVRRVLSTAQKTHALSEAPAALYT